MVLLLNNWIPAINKTTIATMDKKQRNIIATKYPMLINFITIGTNTEVIIKAKVI